MPVIKIPFNASLTNVSVPRGNVTLCQVRESASTDRDTFALEQKTLAAFGKQLAEIQRAMQVQNESIHSLVTKVATAIAGEALGSDNELVEQRVIHFAEVLMQQVPAESAAATFVHPDCLDTLKRWATEAGLEQLEIRSDANLTPGDCRVEVGGKGLVASLESFLAAAAKNDRWTKGGNA